MVIYAFVVGGLLGVFVGFLGMMSLTREAKPTHEHDFRVADSHEDHDGECFLILFCSCGEVIKHKLGFGRESVDN